MKVYVASSWRTSTHGWVVEALRAAEHAVYDYREQGMSWYRLGIDPGPQTLEQMRESIHLPVCTERFNADMDALREADAVVLVLPCNRSAHLELGYAVGRGKVTGVLWTPTEPELMYRMVDFIVDTIPAVVDALVWYE